jgi:chromosome segregation ATPase
LDNYTIQLNHVQAELQTSSEDLIELVREDERLSSADRTKTILREINDLSMSIAAVLKKAAKICKVPYRKTMKVDDLIAGLEKELEEFNSALVKADETLTATGITSLQKRTRKKGKISKISDLESIVEKIKAMVAEKNDQLRDLQALRTKLVQLYRLDKTARLDLTGELARLEKQKARASVINEIKTKQEYRKQNVGMIRDKITEIENNIDLIRKKQFTIGKRKQFNDQKMEKIRTIKAEIDNCISMLNAQKSQRAAIISSSDIWYQSIQYRIKKVRQRIGFGSLLRLMFLPFQCYNRYLLGLNIRKYLVKVERSLQQLGLLDEEYVYQADIFNRKNKKGQRLCLDILYCR